MTGPSADTEPPWSGRLSRVLARTGLYTLLLAALCFTFRGDNLAIMMFRRQDLPVLLLAAILLLLLARWRPALPPLPRRIAPHLAAAAIAIMVLLAAWAGTWLVFGGYALTRDEIAANFDAAFLADGMVLAPIPVEWRAYSGALMPQFMLPLPANVGWLSAYLPGNAALRAAGLATVGADWVNPILAAISVAALYRIGRRLWPGAPLLPLLPVLLLASSAQFLTMAMTAYAMPAHLAFNLLWLWCFLRNDRRGDAGAIAAGFVATGLHQIVFHPLFVLPFLVELWFSGGRRRAAIYAAAYILIGLFWVSYWQIVLTAQGATGGQGPGGLSYLAARVLALVAAIDWSALLLTTLNLARFLSWQNILLLPLALLAWPAIRRGEGVARPLAAGVLLTIATMLVLLPWQGHGWGYRYLHGLLGSLCLLAGYGWQSLAATADGRRPAGALAVGTAASLLLVLPLHLKQAHDFVAPYRAAYAAVARAPADLVLVDGTGLLYAEDLVRNAPDLSNRPRIMDVQSLTGAQIADLCGLYRIARFGTRQGAAFGIPVTGPPESARARLLDRLGCGAPPP